MSVIDFIGNNNGTSVNMSSTNIVEGINGKSCALTFNGSDEKITFGDVGTIRSLSFAIKPNSTTEEIILLDSGKTITVSSGTITYTGITATATYVESKASTSLVADAWQTVVIVLSADVSAETFELATDGSAFGAIALDSLTTYSSVLTGVEASDISIRIRRGDL